MNVRGQFRERVFLQDHRLNPQAAFVGSFEVWIFNGRARIDEAHRGVKAAMIGSPSGQVHEDRIRVSANDLNRDPAPGVHPGAS